MDKKSVDCNFFPRNIASVYSQVLSDELLSKVLHSDSKFYIQKIEKKELVIDSTEKYQVIDQSGQRVAFILMANPDFPDTVESTVKAITVAVETVGPSLSEIILQPIHSGYSQGRSYAIYKYLSTFKCSRITRIVAQSFAFQDVQTWLLKVAERTTRKFSEDMLENYVVTPLKWIIDCSVFSPEIREQGRKAINNLEKGIWSPGYVLSHGDLWDGNILIESSLFPSIAPFGIGRAKIIDWGSSSVFGIPFFDIIKFYSTSGLSFRKMGALIWQVLELTKTDYSDGLFDLLSGMARLGMNRGQFPLDQVSSLTSKTINLYKQMER